MELHPDLQEFVTYLREIERLLRGDDNPWADKVSKCADEVECRDAHGVKRFLSYLGGMGSLNDVVLMSGGKPLRRENDQLHELIGKASDLGRKLWREAEGVGAPDGPLPSKHQTEASPRSARKKPVGTSAAPWVIGLFLLILVLAAAAAARTLLFQQPAVITDISAYPRLLKDNSSTGLVDHFPRALPGSAVTASMAAEPGFLQGAGYFQLRLKLPSQEVEAIAAKAKATAVRSCPTQCTGYVEDPEFWKVPMLVAGSQPPEPFPSDFVVYALKTNGDWNHPTGAGVAVSVTRGEVVYWAAG